MQNGSHDRRVKNALPWNVCIWKHSKVSEVYRLFSALQPGTLRVSVYSRIFLPSSVVVQFSKNLGRLFLSFPNKKLFTGWSC